jgi:nucleoside-diphosphate-sugar epimerase
MLCLLMRVLIVGCGYVGLPLGVELVRQGHKVFGLRRNRSAEAELKAAGIEPLCADVAEATELVARSPAYDWVVDCVSAGGGGVEAYNATYLQGMRNLLAWLEPAPPKRFVYTSSTSVYGQTGGEMVDEASPAEPSAATGRILVATESELLGAARKGFPGVVLRLAGIYGPGRGYWLKQFLSGEARVEGAGDRVLNMVHRDDVVGAILAALEGGRAGEVYNVVDDEPVTQRALFQWLSDSLGKPMPPAAAEPAPASKRGISNKRVSNHKLKTELSYRFKYPTFREGFAGSIMA